MCFHLLSATFVSKNASFSACWSSAGHNSWRQDRVRNFYNPLAFVLLPHLWFKFAFISIWIHRNSSELDFKVDTEQTLLFDVICKTDKYEVRETFAWGQMQETLQGSCVFAPPQVRSYDSEKWVSTEENSFSMELASITAFRRLFNYISGANEEGICQSQDMWAT